MLCHYFKFVSLYRIIQLENHSFVFHFVVNCFQICIFVSDNTTSLSPPLAWAVLWIAFKFVSLYQIIQRVRSRPLCRAVVNCFQICIFVSDNTTAIVNCRATKALWIAFKFVSLYQIIQHWAFNMGWHYCCELLSNLYLCIR